MSKLAASSIFYLPVQAADPRPEASYFHYLKASPRAAVNPYVMVDRTILTQRPEPVREVTDNEFIPGNIDIAGNP